MVSGQQFGPRYDSNFPADKLDEAENLILLCEVHHKLVDDQTETYTADVRTVRPDHVSPLTRKQQ
ncbi:MAG: hypothetical protein DMG40_11525 [Acidobacteria bacterium]|nr:MAG: hypothetical protein DMG40_11525 [Acidobacteriota bacterium]